MNAPDLLFDLGNTRLKWAFAENGELHAAPAALDWPAADLPLADWRHAGIARIGIASVAPDGKRAQLLAILRELGAPILEAATASRWRDLRCGYRRPEHFGVDRWLALIAIYHAAPAESVLVVGAGTALTVDLLEPGGAHRGGVIAPGLAAMCQGLLARAPGLVRHTDGIAGTSLADDSADAIASGCLQAALGLIGLHRRIPGVPSLRRVVLSGGDAAMLARHLPAPCEVRPWLVLEGLAHWLDEPASTA